MSEILENVQQQVNRLYKSHYGKMVSSLLYFSQSIDLESAEDIVQDAFTSALTHWRDDGIPNNPAGWIFRVCRNKALNKIKQGEKIRGFFEDEDFSASETKTSESPIDDQQLKLLFACAHPDFSPKVQVVITLKYVANLKVEAIAKILGMTVDGVDKLLLRARQKIRDEKILFTEPDLLFLKYRIPIVHKIIYLIFNEGYKSSWGKEIIREELCEDALLMNKALLESGVGNRETAALHAMMLFSAARFKARFGAMGELLDLEEQDRSLWNKDLILYGSKFLSEAQGGVISSYHYEASVAYLHCMAKSFRSTDWESISMLYKQLLENNPNPFVEMNYAIALYYAGHKQKATDILQQLQQKPFLNQYYLLNAALGKINLLEGNLEKARTFFLKTLTQTESQVEKEYVQKLIDKIDN
ncbi:RNA polymerase sigma factor [Dyadobacter psychrotolerans]|uniref:Sigma-70 family RNA polymerase sigma factor n=1 Tax=Dyadobacter psychrotolerans TaxID=2541721 RepID=A0A4V2Z4T6_9BACT|nr:sigma-70 family RNA polymerase sigma factor [Dyadobacter psychrotolerans]TDE17568.1 sigma-70 family RNA polymerase sigma factor [Dyadobacter psychrotolerans]